MKLGIFFEKFDQLADAPDTVVKMRELVFELAVRGRLSDRRASDLEDAEWINWLENHDEKDRNSQPDYTPIFEIPSLWRWSTLSHLGEAKPRNDSPDSATCSFVPMALISADYGQAVQYEERIWREVKKGYTHFKDGDVVMAKITPCFENGKSAVVDNLAGGIGAGTTELHVFRRGSKVVDPRFVLLYIKSHGYIERGIPRMTGSAGQKRVPSDYFSNSPFPLPPPAEQKRIVAKVDELMALCNRLEAQQKERGARHVALSRAVIAHFDEAPSPANLNFLFHNSYSIAPASLRDAVLNLAIQGRLVPQDPNDESPVAVLKRFAERGLEHKVRRNVPAEVNRPNSVDAGRLPRSWLFESTARLIQLGVILDLKDGNHGANHPKSAEFTKAGLPFITAAQVSEMGEIDYAGAYKISGEPLRRLRVGFARPRDVIYTHKGSVGRVGICSEECVLSPQTTYYRLNGDVLTAEYLRILLISPFFRSQVDEVKRQTTRDFVSISAQYLFFLGIPPIEEQKRIVAKMRVLLRLLDQLEAHLAESQIKSRNLLDAVVHELLHSDAHIAGYQRDRLDDRAAISCYAIQRLGESLSFGRTMLMKVCYLSETHLGIPLGWQPMRQAAGPWDPWIEDFESLGKRSDWFTVAEKGLNKGHTKIEYHANPGLKAKAAEAITVLGNQKAEFDRLLNLFADRNTEEAEIIATLFAAWNDSLIDGKTPTDDEIIREVRENWHHSKGRFSAALLKRWLDWIRQESLAPKGLGPRTRQQLKLALN